MGFLKSEFGMNLAGETPEGTCRMCGTEHKDHMPHSRNSLVYQYKFFDQYGRWPTWDDALSHCPEEIKAAWTEELEKRNLI